MAARYLLDTDICIYLRSNDRPAVTRRFAVLERDEAAVSVISFGELLYGAARSKSPIRAQQGIEWLLRTVRILPLPMASAAIYGHIRAELSVPGRVIGPNDLWIAAHALAENLVLVTNNGREFRRVKGLKIENWAR